MFSPLLLHSNLVYCFLFASLVYLDSECDYYP